MYLTNKKVFLAGATGLIGTGILRYLLHHYPGLTIRASYYQHVEPFIKDARIEYVRADLRSIDEARVACRGCDCAVMSAALTAGAGVFSAEPWKLVNDNVIMNVQMLQAFHEQNVRRVVFISSATAYQEFEGFIREDELDLNQEPYAAYRGIGWVARFTEKICRFWHEQAGADILIARAANIFGPYSIFDSRHSNFIPALIRKAVDKMDPFEVWGTPEVKRDVLYVDDFARAIAMILDHEGLHFDVFNIGSGHAVTVQEVVDEALKACAHKPIRVSYDAGKPSTIRFRALNCAKTNKILNWQPQITFSEGIRRTAEWWVENKGWWKK